MTTVDAQEFHPPRYRVLVTGSRDWEHPLRIDIELDRIWHAYPYLVVVHGGARGADQMAEQWARAHAVPTEVHQAYWGIDGKMAGRLRNQRMVDLGAGVCLAFIRDHSRGATHCATIAIAAGIPTVIIRDDEPQDDDVTPVLRTYRPVTQARPDGGVL